MAHSLAVTFAFDHDMQALLLLGMTFFCSFMLFVSQLHSSTSMLCSSYPVYSPLPSYADAWNLGAALMGKQLQAVHPCIL